MGQLDIRLYRIILIGAGGLIVLCELSMMVGRLFGGASRWLPVWFPLVVVGAGLLVILVALRITGRR